jgi:hypothetical protein
MAVYRNFECRLSLPECDPDKLDDLKKKLRDIIDSPDFTQIIGDLKANAAYASSGPKPKSVSGEVRIYAEASSRGEARVGASVGIRF